MIGGKLLSATATAAPGGQGAVAFSLSGFPGVVVYSWDPVTGFGGLYTNPAVPATGDGQGVSFSPDGSAIAVAHSVVPYISAYPWSGGGFGTRFSNPATFPTGQGTDVTFSPDGSAVALTSATTPFIFAYPWSGSGFGTKYTNPASLPVDTGSGVAFSPDGSSLAMSLSHVSSPFTGVTLYPWSSSGFGAKYANPSTVTTGRGNDVAFSTTGFDIAVAHDTTPFISVWPRVSGGGFGTKYANPATLPTGNASGVAFGRTQV